tara:strand:+ start:483 stop:740 length:258 start_codon:yes stop_codon:yes gene_type:complete
MPKLTGTQEKQLKEMRKMMEDGMSFSKSYSEVNKKKIEPKQVFRDAKSPPTKRKPKKVFMSPKKEPKKVMKFYDAKSPPTERKKK